MTTAVQPISAVEIVRIYGVTTANLYVIAHRRKWRRILWEGRAYYDLADVDRDLGRSAALRTTPV